MKIVFYILSFIYLRESVGYRQEFAKVVYYNQKYVVNPKAMTSRTSRTEPYRTNISLTTLHPWENNVTISYNLAGIGPEFKWKNKVCEINKYNWIVDLLKSSSVNATCPMPAKFYNLYNLENPP